MQEFAIGTAGTRRGALLAHRDDVDGLRAIAVLAILAFHLGLAGFTGGFVGVDIFFVISGYVILRSILPDLESGRFSIAGFFIRRLRRILPALTVVLAATLAAGFLILSPAELNELSGSALATMVFGANFFFHDRTGYFASAAHTRPLLHMWSLGIEEQFYIFVPVTLAALMRFFGVRAAKPIVILAAGSFAYGLITATAISENHAFYMPMARFWEIAVGGCVAVTERRWGLPGKGCDAIALLGLVAIGAAVVLLNSDIGQQWTVIAVLGAATVIAAGAPRQGWVAAILASKPMARIGHISYSIYLVHWPLIVFWRLCTARPLLPHEQVSIFVLTLALAATLSVFVETPMRAGSRQIGNRAALGGIVMATAVVATLGLATILDHGAAWRMNPSSREALAALRTAVAERPRCVTDKKWLAAPFSVCRFNPQVSSTHFIIWGDSHAGALAPELATLLGEQGRQGGVLAKIPKCAAIASVTLAAHKYSKVCPAFDDAVLRAIARDRPKLVVIAGRWAILASNVRSPGDGETSGRLVDLENNGVPIELADALARTIERVNALGARVIIVGPVPEIDFNVPATLVRSLQGFGRLPAVRRADFDKRQELVLRALTKIATRSDASVVYPHAVLCDNETCAVADGIRSLYLDDDHLSPFGSSRVNSLIRAEVDRIHWARSGSGAMVVAPNAK